MDFFGHITDSETTLHHLYILEGEGSVLAEQVKQSLFTRDPELKQSGNLLHQTYETVKVDDADVIRTHQTQFAPNGKDQFIIIEALAYTLEAQQKLLKAFEEPKAQTHFFLLVPQLDILLPTVRSRAYVARLDSVITEKVIQEAKIFFTMSLQERLDFIQTFVDGHEDDETSGGLRSAAMQFLAGLAEVIRKVPEPQKYQQTLTDIFMVTQYLGSPGASVKMILEYIALTL